MMSSGFFAQSMTSAAKPHPGIRAFDALFAMLHPTQFREFSQRAGKLPNLCLPQNVWDKYLWRKLFDHDPQFTVFCDKLAAKRYAAERCPDLSAAEVLWQGGDIREAPPELLKGPGFLKSNYGSGFYLRLDERLRSLDELHAITTGWHRGWHHTKPKKWKYRGQWGYKNVKRTLFIEEDLSPQGAGQFLDFAVYVYGGTITHFTVMLNHKMDKWRYAWFEPSGRRSPREIKGVQRGGRATPLPDDFELPVGADAIRNYATTLAGDSDHLRIDLMCKGTDIHFSEITVYSQAGYIRYINKALLSEMTQAWDLRRSWFLTHPQTGWRRLYADWLRRALNESDSRPVP